MSITDWPECERPRERLLSQGAQALSDAELLAIFLRTGIRGKSAVDLARELLQGFGGLRSLLRADHREFCSHKGLGTATFVQLQAILEMARRHLQEQLKHGSALENPQHTRDYLASRMREYQREVFACLFLDNRHRVIACEELFQGSISSASVHPREVVKSALAHNAGAVILAHNHPSGVAEPSEADRNLTRKLQDVLALIEVRVLDHLVIGDQESVSFAERGLI